MPQTTSATTERHNQLFALLAQQSQSEHVDKAAGKLRCAPVTDSELARICRIAVGSFDQCPQEI